MSDWAAVKAPYPSQGSEDLFVLVRALCTWP